MTVELSNARKTCSCCSLPMILSTLIESVKKKKTIEFYFRVKTLRVLIELHFQLFQTHSKWQQPSPDHHQLDSIRVTATAKGELNTNIQLLFSHLVHVSGSSSFPSDGFASIQPTSIARNHAKKDGKFAKICVWKIQHFKK